MARYLVTGGCGFIGSHLVDALLAAGHGVIVLDNLSSGRPERLPAGCPLVVADAQDRAAVGRAMQGVDGCFHLAAIASVALSDRDWLASHAANQTATITVFDAARGTAGGRQAVPVVYASSAAVYGDCPDLPLSEAEVPRPLTAYGADKAGSELHARAAQLVHGVPTLGLRFFNVYGPRQDPRSPYSGVISIFVDRLRRGLPLEVFGDGGQVRDFVHVGDAVTCLLAAMAAPKPAPEVLNVCTGRPVTILELAATLAQVLGRHADIEHRPARRGDIRISFGDPSRAARVLGTSPATTLESGLRLTVADQETS